jgi:lysophospholipase L1-like esterase
MEYLGLDLHGIFELVDMRGRKIFSRYPQHVNETIGHTTAYQLNCTEIRLVPLSDCFITLESMGHRHMSKVMVYYGDYAYPEEFLFTKEVTIPIQMLKFNEIPLPKSLERPLDFSSSVVRIMISSENVLIKAISGNYRLPTNAEVPILKMMAYGTSITQGYSPTAVDLTYPNIVAREMGADLVNFGLAGNAKCEPEVTDFLKTSGKYDVILLELSVNMLMMGFSAEQFKERVEYMITELKKYQPKAKILCLGVLPFYGDHGLVGPRDEMVSDPQTYRKILKEVVESYNSINITYLDPLQACSIGDMSADLIHPGNIGMIKIAHYILKHFK